MPLLVDLNKKSATRQALSAHQGVTTEARHRNKPARYPWKVLHACESAGEILALVEGQIVSGMRPFLLTPAGSGVAAAFSKQAKEATAPISLLKTWSHVREWRRLLHESAAETSADIIHAHSFASGMAAVRGSSSVVYQLRRAVEKIAAAAGHCSENSWLAHSFRVAEQFVLTRAAAVIVNHHCGRLECLERGVRAENLFLIPNPVDQAFLDSVPDREWLEQAAGGAPETTFFLIPAVPHASWELRDAVLRWMRVLSIVARGSSAVKFLFLADSKSADTVNELASACNLSDSVRVLPAAMRNKAMATADVVICGREHAAEGFAIEALARGRALLAADAEEHRDISADGRGCLWFRSGDVADIAQRSHFLAGNAQFRQALGIAGREHCLATRSAEVVASQHDAVYRLAFSRRKGRETSPPRAQLIPLQVGG